MCQTIDMSDVSQKRGRTQAEELGVLIKETQAVLNQRMNEVLRPLGLGVAQYACLQNLHDAPGITGSELARRVFVSRQSMNVLLQSLEKRGLVSRAEAPRPRRERGAALTPHANTVLTQARAAVAEIADTMVADLDASEHDQLSTLLTTCRNALARNRT